MTKPTQWPCRGCGAMLSGRGGKRYCGPDCRPRCSVDGCGKPRHGDVYCSAHHARWKKYGDPLAPLARQSVKGQECSVDGCGQPMRKHPYCASHYSMMRKYGEIRPWSYRWANEAACLTCGQPNGGFRSRRFCSAACFRYWSSHGGVPPNPNCVRCGVEIDLQERGRKGQRRRSTVKLCRRCKVHHRTQATPGELARLDGPYCQLCGCDVDLFAVFPDPMRPSVDHIVPRAWGGSDDADNNQLTHLLCNQIKSDRYFDLSWRSPP